MHTARHTGSRMERMSQIIVTDTVPKWAKRLGGTRSHPIQEADAKKRAPRRLAAALGIDRRTAARYESLDRLPAEIAEKLAALA